MLNLSANQLAAYQVVADLITSGAEPTIDDAGNVGGSPRTTVSAAILGIKNRGDLQEKFLGGPLTDEQSPAVDRLHEAIAKPEFEALVEASEDDLLAQLGLSLLTSGEMGTPDEVFSLLEEGQATIADLSPKALAPLIADGRVSPDGVHPEVLAEVQQLQAQPGGRNIGTIYVI